MSRSSSDSSDLSRSGEEARKSLQSPVKSSSSSSSSSSRLASSPRYFAPDANKTERKALRDKIRQERAERRARRQSVVSDSSTNGLNGSGKPPSVASEAASAAGPALAAVAPGSPSGRNQSSQALRGKKGRGEHSAQASTGPAGDANTAHNKSARPGKGAKSSSKHNGSKAGISSKRSASSSNSSARESRSRSLSSSKASSSDSDAGDRAVATAKKAVKTPVAEEDFTKLKLIGRGAVGHVYVVEKKSDKKLYAMKILDKKEMVRRNKVKRALTEREILATADHPFIVTLYWSFMSKDKLFFIMDYCAGGEFFRVLQSQPGKCLSESAVRFYTAEVLLALEYLHFQGFVYRDLKPENILMHASGHIMLTDFDLSKQAATNLMPHVVRGMFEKAPSMVSIPALSTTSFVGTTEYIAPEVIKGFGQSSAVDWWTFGVLTYEMLFAETPFRAADSRSTLDNILTRTVKVPKENYHGKVSSACRNMIKKLLHQDQKKRLGAKRGAQDLKSHEFYEKVNFALIRNERPPIVPELSGKYDTKYFRANLEERKLSDTSSASSSDSEFDEFADINRKPRHPGAEQ